MGGLPRRDLWLLPLIAVLTVLSMLAVAEAAARIVWPEQLVNGCRKSDPVLGYRNRPDCVSVMKAAEGPWYENRYNECGYRSAASCGPVAPGTPRVAMLGSSIAEGYLVGYADTMASQLEGDLGTLCSRRAEVQNLGGIGYFGAVLAPRMDEALRLKPDALVLVMMPFDLEGLAAGERVAVTQAATGPSLQQRLFADLKLSRALVVAQHVLFETPSVYLPLYLRYGDKADFLRPPFSPSWQARLRAFDAMMGTLADKARQAGIPFMVAFVPQEAEVALMAHRAAAAGTDPEALPAALATIAEAHGATFADTSHLLRREPAPERLYYQVDGHLAGDGQRIAAKAIATNLAGIGQGPLAACHAPAPGLADAAP